MLFFDGDEVAPIAPNEARKCCCCGGRTATWRTRVDEESGVVCAHCLMYSDRSAWAVANKEEILHVGRRSGAMAAMHKKPIPKLDPLGRLDPGDAEKFILGVAYTTRMIQVVGL